MPSRFLTSSTFAEFRRRQLHRLATLALAAPLAAHATRALSSKSLVGHWQQGSPETPDARPDSDRFFADARFVFELSQFDGSKRLVALRGHWRRVDGGLAFRVTARTELVGGRIGWSPGSSNGRALTGTRRMEIDQPGGAESDALIAACASLHDADCIAIHGVNDDRISFDPAAR